MIRFKWLVMILWIALLVSRSEAPDDRAIGYITEMAIDDTCRDLVGMSADELRRESQN